MNDIETRHDRILLGEYLDFEDRRFMQAEELELRIKEAMLPGGSHDPFGSYESPGRGMNHSWLGEALEQNMSFEQWMELSKLLRGGFDKQACDMIRDVAKKYAESCARAEFEWK